MDDLEDVIERGNVRIQRCVEACQRAVDTLNTTIENEIIELVRMQYPTARTIVFFLDTEQDGCGYWFVKTLRDENDFEIERHEDDGLDDRAADIATEFAGDNWSGNGAKWPMFEMKIDAQ